MDKPKCVICDIDGTLAIHKDRSPHDLALVIEDAPRQNMARLLWILQAHFTIVYVSGRQQYCEGSTRYWLWNHGFPIDDVLLFMREDKDNRQDALIKKEIFQKRILPRYEVFAVLDDRNQVVEMWREAGLLCLQVNEGDF